MKPEIVRKFDELGFDLDYTDLVCMSELLCECVRASGDSRMESIDFSVFSDAVVAGFINTAQRQGDSEWDTRKHWFLRVDTCWSVNESFEDCYTRNVEDVELPYLPGKYVKSFDVWSDDIVRVQVVGKRGIHLSTRPMHKRDTWGLVLELQGLPTESDIKTLLGEDFDSYEWPMAQLLSPDGEVVAVYGDKQDYVDIFEQDFSKLMHSQKYLLTFESGIYEEEDVSPYDYWDSSTAFYWAEGWNMERFIASLSSKVES